MNTTSAPAFLRACRAHSSHTLTRRPACPSTARAPFHTERLLVHRQRTAFERRSGFSTSCAGKNAQATSDVPSPSHLREPRPRGHDAAGENVSAAEAVPAGAKDSAGMLDFDSVPYRAWEGRDLKFVQESESYTGRVTRTGTMRKTVRVSRNVQVWDQRLQKYYTRASHALVHDPEDLLVEGDLVSYGAFPPSIEADRRAKGRPVATKGKVAFTVFDVLTPFGSSVAQRLRARMLANGATELDVMALFQSQLAPSASLLPGEQPQKSA